MPCVRIAIGLWAVGQEAALIVAVQSALVSAFRIPEGDRDVVLDLCAEERRSVPAGRSERYTRVEFVGIAARSPEGVTLPALMKPFPVEWDGQAKSPILVHFDAVENEGPSRT